MNTEKENSEKNQPLEENPPSEDEIEPTPDTEESLPEEEYEPWEVREAQASALGGDFDVDAALASIATLSDLGIDDDSDDEDDFEPDDASSDDQIGEEINPDGPEDEFGVPDISRSRAAAQINVPPIYDFSRGQLASIVPALALMIYGAWLTFVLSSDAAPSLTEALVFALIAIGASIFSYWLSSGRLANGAGMIGLSLIIVPASLYFITINDTLGVEGWPLLIVAVGIAQFLSSILSRGTVVKGGFTGLLLMLMGGFAYMLTSQTLDFDIDKNAEVLLPVLGVFAVILLIAPLLPRRR